MRMLRIEMRYSHPLDRRAEIGLDTAHHVTRDALQIETLAEFRRIISFHRRGSPPSCQARSFEAMSTPTASAENPVFCGWSEALSLVMYRPWARQCPVTRFLAYVTRTEHC